MGITRVCWIATDPCGREKQPAAQPEMPCVEAVLGGWGYKRWGRGCFGSVAGRCEGHTLGRSSSIYGPSMQWRLFGKNLATTGVSTFPGLHRAPVPGWGGTEQPLLGAFPRLLWQRWLHHTNLGWRQGWALPSSPPHSQVWKVELDRELPVHLPAGEQQRAGSQLLSSPQHAWKTTAAF